MALAAPVGGVAMVAHEAVERGMRPGVWASGVAVFDGVVVDVVEMGAKLIGSAEGVFPEAFGMKKGISTFMN